MTTSAAISLIIKAHCLYYDKYISDQYKEKCINQTTECFTVNGKTEPDEYRIINCLIKFDDRNIK